MADKRYLLKSLQDSETSELRSGEMRQALKEYHLPKALMYPVVFKGRSQAYHNHQHCYEVALGARKAAEEDNMSVPQIKALLIAGLYHDYDHTGVNQVSDVVNIKRAVRGVKIVLALLPWGTNKKIRKEVISLIWATENSHSTPITSASEGIIRDADLVATLSSQRSIWLSALEYELDQTITDESTRGFLQSNTFHSAWGRARVEKFLTETA